MNADERAYRTRRYICDSFFGQRRDCQATGQISSYSIVLKKVSTISLS